METTPMWILLVIISVLFCAPLIVYLILSPKARPNEPVFTRPVAVIAIGIIIVGVIFALGGYSLFGVSTLTIGMIILHVVIWNLRQYKKKHVESATPIETTLT